MVKALKLYLLRHAQSMYNAYRLEEPDVDLSEVGVQQAKNVNCDVEFDIVVCSPLKRCRQTLEHSGIKYKNLIVKHSSREWRKYVSDMMEGEKYAREPEEDMKNRIDKLRTYLLDLCKKQDSVLLVAHYWTINFLTTLEKDGQIIREGLCPDNAQLIEYNFPL